MKIGLRIALYSVFTVEFHLAILKHLQWMISTKAKKVTFG